MRIRVIKLILANVLISLIQFSAFAQSDKLTLNYPELNVTPLASDRLRTEANLSEGQFYPYFPGILASSATLVAGFLAMGTDDPNGTQEEKDEDKSIALLGTGIGFLWLGLHVYYANYYTPYSDGLEEIKNLPNKRTRDKLTRERRAESHLRRAKRHGKYMRWLSSITLLGANIAIASSVQNDPNGSSDERAEAISYAAAAGSLLTLLFPYHWEKIWWEQRDYKKKIYAPVSTFAPIKGGGIFALNWRF